VGQYAKVSGGIWGQGSSGSGHGKGEPTHSFRGFVGDAGGTPVGQITINYHLLDQTCTFTPDSGSGFAVQEDGYRAYLTNWVNDCTGNDANLVLLDRDWGIGWLGLDPNPWPRGLIAVDDAPVSWGGGYDIWYNYLDIPGNIDPVGLDRGNVHVVDLSL